jgi:hypothetical protein
VRPPWDNIRRRASGLLLTIRLTTFLDGSI